MLQSITWSQYFLFMIAVTLIYYLYTWIVYFQASLEAVKMMLKFRSAAGLGDEGKEEGSLDAAIIIERLRPVFQGHQQPHSLVKALKQALSKYSFRNDPEVRKTITQFIITESEHQCSIRLGEDDLGSVWL